MYIEALTPNMTAFENRAFKEISKIKWGLKGMALELVSL